MHFPATNDDSRNRDSSILRVKVATKDQKFHRTNLGVLHMNTTDCEPDGLHHLSLSLSLSYHDWLVVSTHLKNMKVSWDDYSQHMEK